MEDKRSQLLEESLHLFMQYGFRKTTLDDIADRVGIAKSSLYHYFKNKDELIRASTSYWHGKFENRLREILDSEKDIRKALMGVSDMLREVSSWIKPNLPVLLGEAHTLHPLVKDIVDEFGQRMESIFRRRLEEAVEEGQLAELPSQEVIHFLMILFKESSMKGEVAPHMNDLIEQPLRYIDTLLKPYAGPKYTG